MALVRQLPSCAKDSFGLLSNIYAWKFGERNRIMASLKVKSSSFAVGLQGVKSIQFRVSPSTSALALKNAAAKECQLSPESQLL